MKISYVLPVYNSAAFLTQTLESLFAQKHKDFEIIIIDDASTDYIEPLKVYYSDIKEFSVKWITNKKRMGAAYCRNIGNKEATGDVIAVCDAGDIYLDNRGLQIEKFFTEHPDTDIVHTHVQVQNMFGKIYYVQEAMPFDGNGKPQISHPTVAYRKKVVISDNVNIQNLTFIPISYHEGSFDTDFYEFFLIDAVRAGFKLGIIPKITTIKIDLHSNSSYRDVKKAKTLKFKKYQEYGIKIKQEEV